MLNWFRSMKIQSERLTAFNRALFCYALPSEDIHKVYHNYAVGLPCQHFVVSADSASRLHLPLSAVLPRCRLMLTPAFTYDLSVLAREPSSRRRTAIRLEASYPLSFPPSIYSVIERAIVLAPLNVTIAAKRWRSPRRSLRVSACGNSTLAVLTEILQKSATATILSLS